MCKDGAINIALFRRTKKEVDVYYMRHAIEPKKEYRGLGIYNDYLDKIIAYCKERGFIQIVSCFVLSNIDIYRTKIKKIFILQALKLMWNGGNLDGCQPFLNDDP